MKPANVSRVATARVTALLGACLLQLGQFDQAETHLLDAYHTLSEIGAAPADVNPVIKRLIELYETTGDVAEANAWRDQLGAG
jgi:hypothetical protein